MHTAQHLMDVIKCHAPIVIICDNIVFNLAIHNSYMVERLSVQTDLSTGRTDIRRIFIPETQLRHIAMHIIDCIERMNDDAVTTWDEVLIQLTSLLNNPTTQGEQHEHLK